MATLEPLVATGNLIKHDPDLDEDELPAQVACFAPAFDTWLDTALQRFGRMGGWQLTPFEQAEQILYEFANGRPIAYSVDYRKLDPIMAHVWELKMPDMRLFGWFARKAHLVLVCGTLKDNVTSFKANTNTSPNA